MTATGGYPKRLIEVDLPIKRISAHARREKSIRHGHISTLHIWWARRPLASCRAVICASLWPDPADENCPKQFRDIARTEMANWADQHLGLLSEESYAHFIVYSKKPKSLFDNLELRKALLDFIADFSNWDNAANPNYLSTSRALTQAAHEALGGTPGTKPLIVDPFAGGGAIPLEALRVGADAFASDLNPVAVLLNKVTIEYIPRYGQQLADEVEKWGKWILNETERELSGLYPNDPDGRTPITYLWARIAKCEGPGCGAEVPLIRSLWLAKKGKNSVALRLVPRSRTKRVDFEIIENAKLSDVGEGTVRRGAAVCPCCGFTTSGENVRSQFKGRRGGADDARLFCVVTTRAGQMGRRYRNADERDLKAIKRAVQQYAQMNSDKTDELRAFPDEPLPYLRSIFNINLLDVTRWKDLFTPRQAITIATLAAKLRLAHDSLSAKHEKGLADAVATCLALAVDRQADYSTSLCSWHLTGEKINHTYGRQALGIIWDFAETCPFADGSGSFEGACEWVVRVCKSVVESNLVQGHVEKASATHHPLPDDSASAFFTDPPYYDAVPYADLSDFFYVWLKRSLKGIHRDLLADALSPKINEVVQLAERNTAYSYKTRENFETLMQQSLAEGRRVTDPNGIGIVVFAHKTTAAWETMLQAVVNADWVVTASWPIDTEMATRLRAMNSAALASSIHLICRPRENSDGTVINTHVGDWRDILAELPERIHNWMPRLAEEGVVGADAIFACLGPALEIFSRYSRVERASGEVVTLKDYLEQVWAAVAKEALTVIFTGADASGFEEDARLTAMWLWTLNAGGNGTAAVGEEEGNAGEDDEGEKKGKVQNGFVLEYDTARKIAQGLGAHLEDLTSVVTVQGDTAALLPVAARTRFLFGQDPETGQRVPMRRKTKQMDLFGKMELLTDDEITERKLEVANVQRANTTLDRVHQAMLMFAANRGEALKRFLVEDGAGSNPMFWRLAQALSALYPAGTDEKRWVDGVLARKKGLGL